MEVANSVYVLNLASLFKRNGQAGSCPYLPVVAPFSHFSSELMNAGLDGHHVKIRHERCHPAR